MTLSTPSPVTQELADQVVQLLELDGLVDEYELRDGAHWYHLGFDETHLKIGIEGKSYGQYPGSAVLLNDDGERLALVAYEEIAQGVIRYWAGSRLAGVVDFNTGKVEAGRMFPQ